MSGTVEGLLTGGGRVVGLDLSLLSAGLVFREGPQAGHTSCTVSAPKQQGISPTTRIYNAASSILSLIKPGDRVVLEDYAINPFNPQITTIELAGVVKVSILIKTGSDPLLVHPTQLKKFAGNSKAKKDEVRLAVFKQWGVEFDTHDEVDAFVLSEIGLAYWSVKGQDQLTIVQKQVLQALALKANPFHLPKKSGRKRKSS